MPHIVVFQKEYDGESLYDLDQDIADAFEPDYNPVVDDIPQDEYGLQKGKFIVSIIWMPEEPCTE